MGLSSTHAVESITYTDVAVDYTAVTCPILSLNREGTLMNLPVLIANDGS